MKLWLIFDKQAYHLFVGFLIARWPISREAMTSSCHVPRFPCSKPRFDWLKRLESEGKVVNLCLQFIEEDQQIQLFYDYLFSPRN